MRLVAIHIYKWINEAPALLCYEMNLDMLWFYQRGVAKEHIMFNTRLIAGRTPPGTKQSISLEDVGVCHCWTTTDGITATVVSDNEYPDKAAFIMMNKVLMEFREQFASSGVLETTKDQPVKFASLEKYLQEWQNPH